MFQGRAVIFLGGQHCIAGDQGRCETILKIAYLTFERPNSLSGVWKKIQFQTNAWREAGHSVENFVIASRRPEVSAEAQFIGSGKFRKPYLNALVSTCCLRRSLISFQPDIIYSRQILWWPGVVWALSGAPLVFEINSLADQEYRLLSRYKYCLYLITVKRLMGTARGLISVTSEIDRQLPATGAKRAVIGNGYDLRGLIPRIPPGNARPQLVFVASKEQSWQGVDKVVRLARLIPEYNFHIVLPGFQSNGPGNLFCHGGLSGEALKVLYQDMDVAIGTLALHRKDMQEASPLKTREYLAYGIPVLAGYRDADLAGADYFLDIGNFEENVEASREEVLRFVSRWIGRSIPRDDVEKRIDCRLIENRRLSFFEGILGREDQTHTACNQ